MDIFIMMRKSLLMFLFVCTNVVAMEIEQALEALQNKRIQLAERTCAKHEKLTNGVIREINQILLKKTDVDEIFELKADLNYFYWQKKQYNYMKKELGVVEVATIIRQHLLEEQCDYTRGEKRGFNENGQVITASKRRKLGKDGSYEGQYLL